MVADRPFTVFVLGGDGIGPEVTSEAARVLETAADLYGLRLDFHVMDVGERTFEATGSHISDADLHDCDCGSAEGDSAILFGAVASEPIGLFRRRYDLYANLRPVRMYSELLEMSPLRPEIVVGMDVLIVRELSSDVYYGEQRRGEREGVGRWASQEMYYNAHEVTRIAAAAFDLARTRRKQLTFAHKANAIPGVFAIWWEAIRAVREDYADVVFEDLYVDNLAAQLCMRPAGFDVILAPNMFGDILSDLCGGLVGSLGVLPSASLNPATGFALYEPVSGTAPTIAGQDIANPVGAILSAALLCRYSLGNATVSGAIEQAVQTTWREHRTRDLAGGGSYVTMSAFGTKVVESLREIVTDATTSSARKGASA